MGEETRAEVRSADGTGIAVFRSGAGRPLVLVHGTTADHARWAPVRAALGAQHALHALDRRGRGASGDAAAYALAREAEDVAAVVAAAAAEAGGPVDLLGHSYGGVCALEAALLAGPALRRLVLYEPPIPTPAMPPYPPGAVEALEALLSLGDSDGLVTAFFRDIVRMPAEELALMRAMPAWPARVKAAYTVARECRAVVDYALAPARFAALRAPALLLLGGASPPFFRAATEALAAALPGARIAGLAGQTHAAMDTAPALFVRGVLAFLA